MNYRGTVSRVTPSGVMVRVPVLAQGYEFGPMLAPPNMHLAVNDPVVVGNISGFKEDLVLLSHQVGDSLALDDLSDVSVPSPSMGDLLTFDGVEWINGPAPDPSLDGLTDVVLTSPAAGDALIYDGADWVNSNVFLATHPVGSFYITENATNPGTLYGGTWVQIQDVFLLAAGSTYTAGTTGGAATTTLVSGNLPAHAHTSGTLANAAESAHTHGAGSYGVAGEAAHTHSGTSLGTNTTGAHKHNLTRDNDAASGTGQWHLHSTGSGAVQNTDINMSSAGDHSHSITGSVGAGTSHTHTFSGTSAAGSSHNHTISGSTGNGPGTSTPVGILPPYLVVYVFKRTA